MNKLLDCTFILNKGFDPEYKYEFEDKTVIYSNYYVLNSNSWQYFEVEYDIEEIKLLLIVATLTGGN
jgi:hypothetical protein